MPKRSSKVEDENQIAARILAAFNEPDENGKNPAAVALGRLGGLKGGKARAEKLSAKRRRAIARKAARTRWGKPRR
jgi:hypothetical protein